MTVALPRFVAGAALGALLVAATAPAWRVLLLGPAPTEEEALQLRCSSRIPGPQAPPPAARKPAP
jgi:hypothetical protein